MRHCLFAKISYHVGHKSMLKNLLGKKQVLLFITLSIFVLLVSCKSNISTTNNNYIDLYSDTISQISTNTYNEIDWMTGESTNGIIVYKGYKLCDIDNDGVDELFVLRQYLNNEDNNFKRSINEVSNLTEFYKYAIRQGFISESYRIVEGKVEQLHLDGEPLMTQAFEGGHFGTYYFLLANGNIAKFYNSYWEENLEIYENMNCKIKLVYSGEPGTDVRQWELNGKKVNKSVAMNEIRKMQIDFTCVS